MQNKYSLFSLIMVKRHNEILKKKTGTVLLCFNIRDSEDTE